MSRGLFISLVSIATFVASGCGSSDPVPPPAIVQGPHQGQAYNLGEGVGYAEVVNDPPIERGREETPTAFVAITWLRTVSPP